MLDFKFLVIFQIDRIQNVELYKQYMAKKDEMSESLKAAYKQQLLEMDLFHGTRAKTLAEINKGGFNRSYQASNGTWYLILENIYNYNILKATYPTFCEIVKLSELKRGTTPGKGIWREKMKKNQNKHINILTKTSLITDKRSFSNNLSLFLF